MKRTLKCLAALALAGSAGCRILETGYGNDNAIVSGSADAMSSTLGAARQSVAWAGAKVLSFGNDLESERQRLFIAGAEHAASAYRVHPDLPEGYRPLTDAEAALLQLPADCYSYERETGYIEDVLGVGFGARLSRSVRGDEIVVSFRGSNAPGEDEHWMQDWIVDAHQGGGGTPKQYVDGAAVLGAVRTAFPDASLTVTGHSLGGGIAAYATLTLPETGRLQCMTYNAAGISSISLFAMPREIVEDRAAKAIVNIRSKGDPVSAIPGTQLVGAIYEVDNLRFANHSIDGLLIDMRRRAEGRRAGWLRDLFED